MEISTNCLQTILDKSYEAIYVTDLDYNVLYVNKGMLALGNINPDTDIQGEKCYQCLLHKDSPCSFCKVRELTPDTFTSRTFHIKEQNRTFELRGQIIDWDGIPAHIEFVRDISGQARAEERLGELSLQQKDIFEHIGVGMCMYRMQNNTLCPLVCNDAYRQLFYLPDTFGDGTPFELHALCLHPEGRELLLATLREHLQQRKPYNHILRVVDPESETLHSILLNMDCVPQTDYTDYWYVSAYDVTDWVNAEARLSNILDNINGGIAIYQITDTAFNTLMFTDGIPKMQGYTREEYKELIAENALDAVYPDDQEQLQQLVAKAVQQQAPFSATYRVHHKNQEYIWVELAANPIGRDSEGFIQYNAVFTNASQQFNLYQQIFDSSKSGLLVTGYDTPEIYFSNKAGLALMRTAMHTCNKRDDKCRCSTHATGNLCELSVLPPSKDCKQRKLEINQMQYQVDAHLIQWMGRPAIVQHFTDITDSISLQSKLQINEDRFQLVVEKSGIKLVDYDLSTGLSYTNMDFNDYAFDYDVQIPDFILNNGLLTIVHPDDRPALKQYYENTQELSGPDTIKLRLRMKDGSYRWTEMNTLYERNQSNEVTRILEFFTDIDASTRQYMELKARFDYENANQLSFENGVIERMTIDLADNLVLRASSVETPTLSRVVGMSIDELLALRLAHISDPVQQDLLRNFMSREKLLQAYYAGKSPTFESYGKLSKSDEQYYYQITARFAKDPNTEHILVFINTQNIDSAKTSAILMQRLLETNYDTAAVVNAKTGKIKLGIMEGDSEFTTNYPLTYDESALIDICEKVIPEDRESVKKALSRDAILEQLANSSRYSDRCTIMENGVLHYKMWTATYFDDTKEYILITVADVTDVYEKDLKIAQELRDALETADIASQSKTEFLARMSHEIRTPISTISGIHDLVRLNFKEGDLITNKLFDYVETANTANQYLLTLINDILDISKIEKNELILSESVTDVRHVILALQTMITPLVQQKGVHLITERKTYFSNWFKMDHVRVQQILMNLLSNAIKFTPKGGTITFTGEILSRTGDVVTAKFVIQDTGIGISEDFQKHLFEPFKQEYTDSRSGYGGTGLGLAISRKLARMMGGDITCESKKGKGSTFSATMKLEIASPQEVMQDKDITDLSGLSGLHILLCEDNKINQTIAASLLEIKGCIVTTADNGRQALDLFLDEQTNHFDLVLMDIQMPLLNGLETASAIRHSNHPDAAVIPIIAMSANAYEEDWQASINAGMNEHLAKPVNAEQLYQIIAYYCS